MASLTPLRTGLPPMRADHAATLSGEVLSRAARPGKAYAAASHEA